MPASLALAIKSREDLAADAAERAEMKRLVLEASQREEDGDSALNRPRNQALPQGGPPKPPAGSGHGHGYYSRGGGTQAGQVQQRCGTKNSLKYWSVEWDTFYVPIYIVYVVC